MSGKHEGAEFLEAEPIAEGKWIKLMRRGRWEFAQRTVGQTAALIVALTEAGELVLIEQPRPPVGGRTIELPAGLIGDIAGEEDEAPEVAALRELEEETGFTAARIERLTQGSTSPGLSDEQLILFRAHELRRVGEGGGDEDEDITVHLVALDEVPAWLASKQAEGLVVDLKVWSALYWARR
ncbi:NUDIX hydrolase [Pseudenhygromyxa sp. WMMC2535]|uniref:NUDIX hydrolase n=1 Tax=Pseudenhygromyxa sp. WMMC2535 TaxID=2712867 RepID=UPI00155790C6|nr:NUDIX hydrolase [Pseudenhygromyxa sp. WMMC2535]NVB39151.1 NUDIX hydrolase [Pseudenhygromyxa sp. WMMC2535]